MKYLFALVALAEFFAAGMAYAIEDWNGLAWTLFVGVFAVVMAALDVRLDASLAAIRVRSEGWQKGFEDASDIYWSHR